MKLRFTLWAMVMGIALTAKAQTPDVVAVPNPDDFLGDTYSLPSDPFAVQAQPAQAPTVSVPSNMDILTEIFGENAVTLNANKPVEVTEERHFKPIPGMYYPKHPVLTKLPDLPAPRFDLDPYVDMTPVEKAPRTDVADKFLVAAQKGGALPFSIPKEIRIKFFSGQSALSAQSLKWIKAFALKVRSDPRFLLEIRASSENWPLQSKRVGIMLQAIIEQGVSRHQIVVYKSARDPESVLLGYALAADKDIQKTKKKVKTISW